MFKNIQYANQVVFHVVTNGLKYCFFKFLGKKVFFWNLKKCKKFFFYFCLKSMLWIWKQHTVNLEHFGLVLRLWPLFEYHFTHTVYGKSVDNVYILTISRGAELCLTNKRRNCMIFKNKLMANIVFTFKWEVGIISWNFCFSNCRFM